MDYEFLSAEETYSFEITEDTVLEARFKDASNGYMKQPKRRSAAPPLGAAEEPAALYDYL